MHTLLVVVIPTGVTPDQVLTKMAQDVGIVESRIVTDGAMRQEHFLAQAAYLLALKVKGKL